MSEMPDLSEMPALDAAGKELVQSLRALKLELPFEVWDAHAACVEEFLKATVASIKRDQGETR